jgi:CPA2 family monovalent cation:H+ antiporter-2
MHDFPIIKDISILLFFSVFIVFFLKRLKLPSIIGFLLTGIVIGPYGLSLINAVKEVEVLSEIGVILLLFVIGMELSLKQLALIKKTVFVAGFIQVFLTVLVSAGIYHFIGNIWNEAVFIGFLFSLSSTAIVLKTLQDRHEITSAQGKNALAILIFQDIIVVPMMLFTPIIAGKSDNLIFSILSLLLKSILVILLTYISAKYIVPKLMYAVAKTKSKDLFLLTTITLCFVIAYLTSQAGLSLALGAFIAGLIISESEYSHQSTSVILPFKELFTSFFFVSVGMLLDLSFFMNNIMIITILLLVTFIIKSIIAGIAVAVLRYSPKVAILTGLSLFQVGEFAFILSKVGISYQLLNETSNQYFLSVSIISMFITPFIILFSDRFTNHFIKVSKRIGINNIYKYNQLDTLDNNIDDSYLNNHLVIIGLGLNGNNLAKVSKASGIPHVVIESNANIVKDSKLKGIPVIYGDAIHPHILEIAKIHQAQSVVIAISDINATKLIIKEIRDISETIHIVVRTRYIKEITELKAIGADEVVPEEFETSIQIFSNVLQHFLITDSEIQEIIQCVREDNYEIFNSTKEIPTFKKLSITN